MDRNIEQDLMWMALTAELDALTHPQRKTMLEAFDVVMELVKMSPQCIDGLGHVLTALARHVQRRGTWAGLTLRTDENGHV